MRQTVQASVQVAKLALVCAPRTVGFALLVDDKIWPHLSFESYGDPASSGADGFSTVLANQYDVFVLCSRILTQCASCEVGLRRGQAAGGR